MPPLSRFAQSIRVKVTGAVLLAVLSAILVASLASAWREAHRRFDFKREELQGVASALAASVSQWVAVENARQIASSINAIGRIRGLTYARVVDVDGRLLYEVGNGVLLESDAETLLAKEAVGPYQALFLSTHAISAPVIHAGNVIGRLELIADVSDLRSVFVDSILQSLLAGLLAAMAGIALSWRLQSSITRPIVRLTSHVEEVGATGNYRRQVPRLSNDETGRLVDAFNGMVGEIRKRDEALSRHRDSLEEQVHERTRELTIAKQAAEAADAAKSDFLATMTHEIRTPMNGMLVMAELLSASGLSPRLQRYSDIIVKSGHSLVAIINDILDLSKIQAGRMDLESIPVDPAIVVEDVLKLFSERASSKNLDLAGFVASDVPARILADPTRLNQVLSNLVNNALKFTEAGGVTVSLICPSGSASPGLLRFQVSDTGIGIAKEKLPNIFKAFSQADQSTTRNYGGTGIGLTISQKLVGAMGGTLSVASTLGEGSVFSFECIFPIAEEALPSTATSTAGQSVVLVMPDGPTRRCLARYLEESYFVATAVEPQDFAYRKSDDIRAVFVDAEWLSDRSRPNNLQPDPDCPLIALSTFGNSAGDLLVASGSADLTIDRPIGPKTMQPLLARLRVPGSPLSTLEVVGTQRAFDEEVSFAGAHVLAADDSAVNREVLIEILTRLGVQVTSVNDGQAAIDAVRSRPFDLIFMDGSMPNVDGYAAARAIRAIELELGRRETPILALTAHVIGEHASRWRDAGMCDHISKPFSLGTIRACLERWIEPRLQTSAGSATPAASAMPPREAPQSALALMDRSVLAQIAEMQGAGDTLVQRILRLYMQHGPEALRKLSLLAGTGDASGLAEAAHALKSLSRSVGAVRVAELCEGIETQATEAQSPLSNLVYHDLESAFLQTLHEISVTFGIEAQESNEGRLRA